jgi:hypothetical protein
LFVPARLGLSVLRLKSPLSEWRGWSKLVLLSVGEASSLRLKSPGGVGKTSVSISNVSCTWHLTTRPVAEDPGRAPSRGWRQCSVTIAGACCNRWRLGAGLVVRGGGAVGARLQLVQGLLEGRHGELVLCCEIVPVVGRDYRHKAKQHVGSGSSVGMGAFIWTTRADLGM